MTQVVKSFESDGILFDVYADGDCVLRTAKSGYIQISADTLKRIMSKSKDGEPACPAAARTAPQASKEKPAPAATKTERILTPFEEAAASKKTEKVEIKKPPFIAQTKLVGEVKKRIAKIEGREGWECVFIINGVVVEAHAYMTRSQARAGAQGNAVGQNGRIEHSTT
jgi:hypothetical protein